MRIIHSSLNQIIKIMRNKKYSNLHMHFLSTHFSFSAQLLSSLQPEKQTPASHEKSEGQSEFFLHGDGILKHSLSGFPVNCGPQKHCLL